MPPKPTGTLQSIATYFDGDDSMEASNSVIGDTASVNNVGYNKSCNDSSQINNKDRHVIIKCVDENKQDAFRNLDAWATVDGFDALDINPKQCKPLRSGGFLVEVSTQEQVQSLLDIKVFCEFNVKVEIAEMVGIKRGVIYDKKLMNKDVSYILEKLKSQDVVKVRPLEKVVNNERRRTPLLVLSFKRDHLPNTIKVGYEIRYVRPYKVRPHSAKIVSGLVIGQTPAPDQNLV